MYEGEYWLRPVGGEEKPNPGAFAEIQGDSMSESEMKRVQCPSPHEVNAARTPRGGWTALNLEELKFAEDAPLKVGRPPGKKSNPDYTQATVYLRKQTHLAAKKRLLDEGKEFSELVEELVTQWIRKSGYSKV